MLFEADRNVQLDRLAAAAAIQATMRNLQNDWEERPQGWVPADFMPGAVIKTEREKLIEFAEAIERGDTFEEEEVDPEELARHRDAVERTISNII